MEQETHRNQPHVLIVTFPIQGHINPALQFAKRLTDHRVSVTFSTTISAINRISKLPSNISIAPFSDGYDDTYTFNLHNYLSHLRLHCSRALKQLILSTSATARRFTCVVYSLFLPWVAEVAREVHTPSFFLWNQAASVFAIYYHYFNGYEDDVKRSVSDFDYCLTLPGLPKLIGCDLPSYFLSTNPYTHIIPTFKEHLELIDSTSNDDKPIVLANTFDALEGEAIRDVSKYRLMGVGPLLPSAFLDGRSKETSYGGDLVRCSEDYVEWLDEKDENSVIYISFGSISDLSKPQMEEMARALLDTGWPFLWVIRGEEKTLSCEEELRRQGKIVKWCSQVEVLSHRSVGCFVTHCGWNSTTESLACGVPVVGFPQFTDQLTDAKMVQDVWKTGIRVRANPSGVVEREEIKRCLELVMGDGDKAKEMRMNALKWKGLARDAVGEGGSSHRNIKAFVNEISKYHHE